MKVFAILSILPLLTFAVPTSVSQYPDVLHPDTHTVALDEVNKRMIAFDHAGRKLGIYSANADMPRRRAGQCFPMQDHEINGIPEIQQLRDLARSKWGGGILNEVVNDEDYPERPMNICADDAGASVVYNGEPSCRETMNRAWGDLEGGKILLQNQQGVVMSTTATVTRTSKWGVGLKTSASITFPALAGVGVEVSANYEFTNTQGSSSTISEDLTTRQRIQQPVDEGQICEIMLTTTTCSVPGKATLKMIATGFLWFQYEVKRAPTHGDPNDVHYKWGMVIEKALPRDKDRSTLIEFKIAGNMESNSEFDTSNCTEGVSVAKHGQNNDEADGFEDTE